MRDMSALWTAFHERCANIRAANIQWAAWRRRNDADNPEVDPDHVGKPDPEPYMPEALPRPGSTKPVLMICLPDLVLQMCRDVRKFSTSLQVYQYCGDKRATKANSREFAQVEGYLTRNHQVFSAQEDSARAVIVTSVHTFTTRHGPGALAKWLRASKTMTEDEVRAASWKDPNSDWPHNLADLFDFVFIDEAHSIKNPDTKRHAAITWLRARFTLLITGTVLPNSQKCFLGYAPIIERPGLWHPDILKDLGVDAEVNPFLLDENHPATILMATTHAVEKFISGPTADLAVAGLWLRKLYKMILIRRTPASLDPAFSDGTLIGKSFPKVTSRQLFVKMNHAQTNWYRNLAYEGELKLFSVDKDGEVIYNARWARYLTLLSTWSGFAYIYEKLGAATIPKWKANPDTILNRWVAMLHDEFEKRSQPSFALPAPTDKVGALAIIAASSPKIRMLNTMLTDLVILRGKKLIVWCSLPDSQSLVLAVCHALGVNACMFSSELSPKDRDDMVYAWNTDPELMVFIGSYYVGSTGLNLQESQCCHCLLFDAAISSHLITQAIGRIRRNDQENRVQVFELFCEGTFQSSRMSKQIEKSTTSVQTELSLCLSATNNNDGFDENGTMVLGTFFWSDGKII